VMRYPAAIGENWLMIRDLLAISTFPVRSMFGITGAFESLALRK
jgi:hypothetical protein